MNYQKEACKLIICTLCGASVREPVTNIICLEVFCKLCLQDYFEKSTQKTSKSCVNCPVCEKEFQQRHLLNGLHRENPALMFVENGVKDKIVTDQVRIKNDVYESEKYLIESDIAFNKIIKQLINLENEKLVDLNHVKQNISRCLEDTIKKIKIVSNKLISQVDGIITEFKHLVGVRKRYYELNQSNAKKLLTSLKFNYDIITNEVLAGLNIEKISARSRLINKQSNLINIPSSILSKYSFDCHLASTINLGEIVQHQDSYVLSEKLSHENLSLTPSTTAVKQLSTLSSNKCDRMRVVRRWSRSFRDNNQQSSQPSGICFFNANQNLAVTENRSGTLISLNVSNGELVTTLIKREKFSPLSLTRLDPSDNFAMIDKNSKSVTETKNRQLNPISKKIFSLPQAVCYHDGKYIVTDTHNKSLVCLTSRGDELWSVGGKDKNIFHCPNYVSICKKRHQIFVSDGKCLKIFDINGNFITSISEPKWQLKGCCVDSKGNVVVIEGSENRVMKLDSDGKYLEDLIPSSHSRHAQHIALSDDDRYLCLIEGEGNVVMFEFY